jgi:phosphoserine phosphatase
MNLVISGPVDDNLRNTLVALVKPRNVVRLHARAYRLESADTASEAREAVAKLCDASRVDHAYVEAGKKLSDFKLLAMDMDSTLITIECIDEIADFAGKKKEVAAITEAAMRGEIKDFAESLRRRVALLAGTSADVLERVYAERLRLSPGALELLAAAENAGLYRLLVSGGFTYFTERLRTRFMFNAAYANVLEIRDEMLTGRVIEPIVDATAKAEFIRYTLTRLNSNRSNAIAIGDGANDIQMMNQVEMSVAYHAKHVVRKSAKYDIQFGGLDVILDFHPNE